MKFANIMRAIYLEPWLITPAMHQQICEIAHDHLTGAAHRAEGRANAGMASTGPDFAMVRNIARIECSGVIGRRVGDMAKSSGAVDVNDLANEIHKATMDSRVDGIMLVFDSPGGTVSGVPEAAQVIRDAAAKKPVLALASGLMASAAYWLASGASMIMAEPSAQVGSIGVYQAFLDESRAFDLAGNKLELFATGKYKGMGVSGLPLSDEQRAEIQARVDKIFTWFKSDINLKRDIPDECMDGRVFMGAECVARDLADCLGTEEDAMQEIAGLVERGLDISNKK